MAERDNLERVDPLVQRATRSWGAALAALIAIVHLLLAPEHLVEKEYIGALFIVGGVVMLGVAGAILFATTAGVRIAWTVGALASAVMIVLGLISRTIGLPGYHEGWETSLIVSLALEAAYLAVWFWALAAGGHALPSADELPRRNRSERRVAVGRPGRR